MTAPRRASAGRDEGAMGSGRVKGGPREFAVALRAVPQRVRAYSNEFLFESTAGLHRFLANTDVTPRVTGYLANGLSIASEGHQPPAQPAFAEGTEYAAPVLDPTALIAAAQSGRPFSIGYQAEYAPYVEDRRHMMKRAKTQFSRIQRDALRVVRGRHP